MREENEKPLVYACSGCSNVAQLANDLAVTMDRENLAEMSCIAGVGGNIKSLVRLAKSGRTIIALDGCPLNCVKACLKNHYIYPDYHFELTTMMGLKKTKGEKCNSIDAYNTMKMIYNRITKEKIKRQNTQKIPTVASVEPILGRRPQ
ncbi:MAG: putative zinc-binding protein [Porticoccaceae bacterium]|jgi:uncharacterized metal-binding protein